MLGISAVVLWTWNRLDQREQYETQRRFALDVEAIGAMVDARLHAYEMVLRGLSSAFAGGEAEVTDAQWNEILEQLRIQELYPGISSVAWSRAVASDQLNPFLERIRADGRQGFKIFPDGARTQYQPIELIGPLTDRTQRVIGLDLLTQELQSQAIQAATDTGHTILSPPLPDLYPVSPEPVVRMGALMYFPVYQTGKPPSTLEERRATHLGTINVAFRGEEMVLGIFGEHMLQLFEISASDDAENMPMFDSLKVYRPSSSQQTADDWEPQFRTQLELPLYGRTWQLEITGTHQYEQSLLSRSQDLVLYVGLGMALVVGLLAGGFMRLRDRQMHASHKVSERLRDQAQQLIVASRYKSEFLANMSHELRTPLNSILILSDQLRQNSAGNLSEKQTHHADIVHRAGSDLLQLINDVLDLSKIEAGRMQISMEPLSLQDLLVDLDAAMRPLAEAKQLHLHIAPILPESGVPQRVYTDRVRMHQILRNLLSNAIKFTDEGQIHLAVTAGLPREDGRAVIHFAVRDTGVGIDPALHDQVFDAFKQLDSSTRRRHGGTGLGLAITKQLVTALDGTIEMESALGLGSTFIVQLPMQSVPDAPKPEDAVPQRSGSGPALLIVEDDSNFADIIIEKAHSHGFSSVHCLTGNQALELLQQEPFVAVILDILLPDISGWQLFRRLRALPEHRHTPVHIISCLPQPAGLEEAQDTHYLTKPVGRDSLEQVFAGLKDNPGTSGPALLLVEDVEVEREYYRQQLTALGFSVTACETAQQARALWSENTFEVLVVDLNLPDQDGFTLLDHLDEVRSLQGTRVVVNTGIDVNCEGLQRLSAYSAVVVRKKGNDADALGQAVQGFLGQISSNSNVRPATTSTAPAPPTAQTINIKGCRLLLVDDDVRNVYAMSALLDDFGLTVSTAGNGEQAIECFKQEPFELILMDMSMPVMDGYTATNLLKTEHGCTIPIIALTAHAMKGDREKCLAAGADDYLAKPVQRDALRTMLERWLALPERDGG